MSKILLIDDEEDIRDSVKKVLERDGHNVMVAAGANEGIAIMQSNDVEIVITDIIMPYVDGVEAIKKIRKLAPAVRILAISGGGNFRPDKYKPEAITTTAYLQAAMDSGADSTLTKPFQKSELLEKVHALLSH